MPEDNKTESIVNARKAMCDDIDEKTARIDELQTKIEHFNKTNEILQTVEVGTEAETNEFEDWSAEKLLVEIGKKRSHVSMIKKKLKGELDEEIRLKTEVKLSEVQSLLEAMLKELEKKNN